MRKILTLFFAVALIGFAGLPVAKAEEVCNGNQGLVVKRVNDNNVSTTFDSAVFVIGCNDTIHIFPNEQIYKTWWPDFKSISYVNGAFIADKDLEKNVTVRPGTYLVKIPTSPKVYAVEPGGILRWIPDEATAKALYGNNWNKIIIDLPTELFSDYTIGENLTAAAYPDGILGYLPEGRVVYLSGTSYYNLPGDTTDLLRFNTKFMVPLSAAIMATFTDSGDLIYDERTAFPF